MWLLVLLGDTLSAKDPPNPLTLAIFLPLLLKCSLQECFVDGSFGTGIYNSAFWLTVVAADKWDMKDKVYLKKSFWITAAPGTSLLWLRLFSSHYMGRTSFCKDLVSVFFFFFAFKHYFILCLWVFCLHFCPCMACMCGACSRRQCQIPGSEFTSCC